MIRISITQVTKGDVIRTSKTEGEAVRVSRSFAIIRTPEGDVVNHWSPAGTVEILSPLNGRTPAESFGRW